MKIKLQGGRSASEAQIRTLETALGCRLPESFKAFVRTRDGAKPETNIFKISNGNHSGVNKFIPAAKIPEERTWIENLPKKAYPVAWAEGGNYVFIDQDRNGAVFYWDHEVPENVVELAADFDAFLELLEPFDITKIELKPGQVKKVWVDPDFLRKLQEKKL